MARFRIRSARDTNFRPNYTMAELESDDEKLRLAIAYLDEQYGYLQPVPHESQYVLRDVRMPDRRRPWPDQRLERIVRSITRERMGLNRTLTELLASQARPTAGGNGAC